MGFTEWCKENGALCAAVLILLVIVVLHLYRSWVSEHMGEVFYLDQMVMKNPDPIGFHYTGRERDIAGMSGRDYYLENDINAKNLVSPFYFEGDQAFVDHTDYLGMRPQYRPQAVTAGVMAAQMAFRDKIAGTQHLPPSNEQDRPASTGASELKVKPEAGVPAENAVVSKMAKEGFY